MPIQNADVATTTIKVLSGSEKADTMCCLILDSCSALRARLKKLVQQDVMVASLGQFFTSHPLTSVIHHML